MERLLTVHEVADRLRVKPRTLREWLKEGRIRASKVGRDWRIEPAAVDEYLRRQGVKVRLDPDAWQAGFDAGKEGSPSLAPAGTADKLAWLSGYIEGKAELEKARR